MAEQTDRIHKHFEGKLSEETRQHFRAAAGGIPQEHRRNFAAGIR